MGLDTSHGCFSGGYHSFNVWRNEIAKKAGYEMAEYDGIPAPRIDWDNYTNDNLAGAWKKTPSDPLIILFAHYDCEGYIQWRHTKLIADRLAEILALLEGDGGYAPVCRERTKRFIDGLLDAHKAHERVEFH